MVNQDWHGMGTTALREDKELGHSGSTSTTEGGNLTPDRRQAAADLPEAPSLPASQEWPWRSNASFKCQSQVRHCDIAMALAGLCSGDHGGTCP